MRRIPGWAIVFTVIGAVAVLTVLSAAAGAQDRLKTMPGYEQYLRMSRQIPTALKSGTLAAAWTSDGKAVEYTRDGKQYRFDIASRQTMDGAQSQDNTRNRRGQLSLGQPERGRQFTSALSPDGRLNAFYKDRNVRLSAADGTNEIAITTDGSAAARV